MIRPMKNKLYVVFVKYVQDVKIKQFFLNFSEFFFS